MKDKLIELYLANGGKPVLISAAAKSLGTSAKKVNEAIDHGPFIFDEVEVCSGGSNFTGYRFRLAPGYAVERRELVRIINELKKGI